MSKIRLLSDHLANQIAAGEVVERPASVVKELLENSLDAGATRVDIQVEGSGARLVRVVDNGEGMAEDDVLLSIERHATSKLGEESSLAEIGTLGFRGEALPSIGSVSRLILVSRPVASQTGTRAEIRYGKLHGVHEAGCAQGTIIEVHNLFGNVPVRKKFLKTARTELHHIEEVVRNQSLAHTNTVFTLTVDGRTVIDFPARTTLQDRFYDVFRCRDSWLHIDWLGSGMGLHLRGYLLQPTSSTARDSRLRILVNGRPVKDKMVRHAVIEGLQGFLMKGHAPAGVLLLDIPPDQVDVNVHPAKHEIRFRQSGDVHRFIVEALKKSLQHYQEQVRADVFTIPEQVAPTQEEKIEQKDIAEAAVSRRDPPRVRSFSDLRKGSPPGSINNGAIQAAEPEPAFEAGNHPAKVSGQDTSGREDGEFSGLKLVGQIFNLYLICEKDDRLLVIDQHAAHERILYEELCRNYLNGAIPRQSLMFPVTVELSAKRAEVMESREADISLLGFQAEHFGDTTWVIKSVPALVSHVDPAELFCESLDILPASLAGEKAGTIAPAIEGLLSSMACKAAVKAGNRLAPEEMLELLATMKGTGFFSHCPHGRPVIKTFSKREIEQWFKRV